MSGARRRLQKGDADLITKALEAQDFEVRGSEERVEAWCKVTKRYICGFYWESAVKPGLAHPARPGGWRFDLALSNAWSVKDLKTSITEARRVRRILPDTTEAWKAFASSKSNSRWSKYRGLVAALFLRQDPPDDA